MSRVAAKRVGRFPLQWVIAGLCGCATIALVTAGLTANVNRAPNSLVQRLPVVQQEPAGSAIAPPNILKPLTPEEAVKENAQKPFDHTPDGPAAKFRIQADQESRARAIECLTQAIYYEAATENKDGRRAVAQVVLNRMRHPGFPSTVCGVVYQGAQLPTGCQFTFTCNGSLMRTPVPYLWNEARKIAAESLDGHVFAAVGHATHYHADYVLPYWADSLAKEVQIGHHIFYRLRGVLGSSAAFSQRYAGKEPALPAPRPAVELAAQATDQAQELLKSGLAAPPPVAADAAGLAAAPVLKDLLVADNNKGQLIADGVPRPVAPKKRKSSDDCAAGSSKQILPESPNDLHAGSEVPGC